MTFRDREKKRLIPLKLKLFSPGACQDGRYGDRYYPFCLHNDLSSENLHESIRDEAIEYFSQRSIHWHDGLTKQYPRDRPSNHLCCSQSACINFWFPFVRNPKALTAILRSIGYDVMEVLPFELDEKLGDGTAPYVSFEWIGKYNYLQELHRGRVALDGQRTRGAGFTSLDFAIRFRQHDGRIRILAGEWKYTEYYEKLKNLRFSKSGTDRLDAVYRASLQLPGCQLRTDLVDAESLLFDPFDQLTRQQLLTSAMEREHEMDADIVSLLHVAPRANGELMNRITSPPLAKFGDDIHAIWKALTCDERFKGFAVEDLLPIVIANAANQNWADYMTTRYGGMI